MRRFDVDNPDPAGPDIDQMTNTLDEGGSMFGSWPYIPPPPDKGTASGGFMNKGMSMHPLHLLGLFHYLMGLQKR